MSLENVEQVLNIYNYFDSVIITDEKGIIKYYTNMRTDVYDLKTNEIIGKTILEIHPELTEESSSIMRVLKTGKPIFDHIEKLTTKHGQCITNIFSTLPIMQRGKLVGAIDLARCIEGNERQRIVLPINIDNSENGLFHIDDIIATSTAMKIIKSMIPKVANTDSSILIYGETGTGKELIAQSIHTYSNRHDKKFVSVNCAAIPSTLIESILFGTVKGSFTGAENKEGLFEIANGGTLFLDEINSMDMNMQAKLLKAIEEKKVTRIGGTEPVHINVKIISALNEDAIACIKAKRLREDLFYRLNVVHIDIPPLRDRIGDILYLTDCFISRYNDRMNKNVLGVSDEVKEIFIDYSWPGNVRELQNVIEGAFNIIDSSHIQKKDLPQYMTNHFEAEREKFEASNENMSLEEKVDEYEKRLIMKALDSTQNIAQAAKKLKISKQNLNYKLSKYKLKG